MLEFTKKTNSAAIAFMAAGAAWFVVGALYGLVSAIDLLSPEFFNNIPWLVFGRTRPVHVNTMLLGFVATTLIGVGLVLRAGVIANTPVVRTSRLGKLVFLEPHNTQRAVYFFLRPDAGTRIRGILMDFRCFDNACHHSWDFQYGNDNRRPQ